VSGPDLGVLLFDHPTLRLAVLNACEGARTAADDPFAGVATSLVQQEIPAVVAMQFEITDRAAIVFSRELYGALADGYAIDSAVAEARKAIFADDNDVEWGTPVLFMRSSDGRLFELGDGPPVRPLPPPEPVRPGWVSRLLRSLSRHRWAVVGAAVAALVAAVAAGVILIPGGNARSALSWHGPDSSGALGEAGVQGLNGVAIGGKGEEVAVGYRMLGARPQTAIWESGPDGWVRAQAPSEKGTLFAATHSAARGTVAVGLLGPPASPRDTFPVILRKSSRTWTEVLGRDTGEARKGEGIYAVASLPDGFIAAGVIADADQYDAVAWISQNGGAWERRLVAGGERDQTLRAVTHTHKGALIAAGRDRLDAAIWRSTDGAGTTWSKAKIEAPGFEIKSVIDDGAELVAAGYDKVPGRPDKAMMWVSRDDGQTWELLKGQPFKESGEQINGLALIGSGVGDVRVVAVGWEDNGAVTAAWTAVTPVTQFVRERSDALSDGGRGFGLTAITAITGRGSASVVAVGGCSRRPPPEQLSAQVWTAKLR
jgi:hypothetical protein